DNGRSASHLRYVAGKLAGAVDGDGLRPIAGFVHDFDFTRLDDEEPRVVVACREEFFPRPEWTKLRERTLTQRGELGSAQLRKGYRLQIGLGHRATSLARCRLH